MKAKPYVGITGIVSSEEARDVKNSFYNAGFSMDTSHIPMVGVLASYKSLREKPTTRRYPKINSLPDLFRATKGKTLNMVHYNSRELNTLFSQVREIFEREEIYRESLCRALQLNIPWPDIHQVGKIKEHFPEM